MQKIYKYPLKTADVQMVEMPKGATILCVQTQGETPCLWAEVNPKAEKICRAFVTYGTGHPLDDGTAKHYIGTYQLRGGALVFHVYTDRIEYPPES